MRRHFRFPCWIAPLVVALIATSTPHDAFADALCAFRAGPRGPCTCKTAGDAAGQFTVVDRARCRPAKAKDARAKAPAASDAPREDAKASSDRPETPPAATAAREGIPGAGGDPIVTGALPPKGALLDRVRTRGKLVCGVNQGLLGFAHRTGGGDWAGLDVDFCRAVAAAVLGDASKVEFVPLDTRTRFDALKAGEIDLLSRNTTWTMGRDAGLGLEFAGVIYFDGQSFITSEERGLVSAQQLAGARICVQSGTTTADNLAYYLGAHNIQAQTETFASREELQGAYLAGKCEAYTADRSSLFADRSGFPEPLKHVILPEVISKEPLGPAVLQGDLEWAAIVRWTLAGLINAEEVGLDRKAAASAGELEGDARRLVAGAGTNGEHLRLDKGWLRTVVAAVGNYGELFEANVGSASPLGMNRGINALWKRGGILYAPPMW